MPATFQANVVGVVSDLRQQTMQCLGKDTAVISPAGKKKRENETETESEREKEREYGRFQD